MIIHITPFLRNVLRADAAVGGVAAVACIAGSGVLAGLTALPAGLLFWAGVALLPIVVALFAMSRRETVSRLALADIVAINAAWTIGSFGLLASGWVAPNMLGIAFVTLQAVAVGAFAVLEAIPLRRAVQVA